jgi:hypothetical protein
MGAGLAAIGASQAIAALPHQEHAGNGSPPAAASS